MNSKMKYPAIIDNGKAQKVLIFSDGRGIHLGGEFAGDHVDRYIIDSDCKNITHEYLANTWGEVLSPEHAEFIIELCEVNGIEVFNGFDIGITNFAIVKNEVIFTYGKPSVSEHDKKITIPLPPKENPALVETKVRYSSLSDEEKQMVIEDAINEDFELHQKQAVQEFNNDYYNHNNIDGSIKNNVAKPSTYKTWPQVGDPVTVFGQQGVLVLPADANGMYVVESNGRYFIPKLSDITKPKSKQDLLIEELQAKLVNNNAVDNYILACDIINGDIEGLIYNPEESK